MVGGAEAGSLDRKRINDALDKKTSSSSSVRVFKDKLPLASTSTPGAGKSLQSEGHRSSGATKSKDSDGLFSLNLCFCLMLV